MIIKRIIKKRELIFFTIFVPMIKILSLIYGWIKNITSKGVEIVTVETKEERLKICNNCPHRENKSCNICGCVIESKVLFSNEGCPISKW